MLKILFLSIVLTLLVLGCTTEKRDMMDWCKGCGSLFTYSELRCNEYGIQFCTSCVKEYPNLFKNILTVEDGNEDNSKNTK